MTTDLDQRITTALHTVAASTETDDDALDTILARASNPTERRPWRRVAVGATAIMVLSGTGAAAWALVSDRPDERTATFIEGTPCGLDADDARLVATYGDAGAVRFWWIDSPAGAGAYVTDLDGSGGGSCAPGAVGYDPSPPWASTQMAVESSGAGRYILYGQIPGTATRAAVVTNRGTFEADPAEDGYFVTVVEGPWGSDLDIIRIDALDADGSVIATGLDG